MLPYPILYPFPRTLPYLTLYPYRYPHHTLPYPFFFFASGAVSISSAAVEFSNMRAGKDLDKTLMDSTVAIIGAGKMTRLLLVHLGSLGMKKVILVNRSMPKCTELIEEFPDMHMDVRLGAEDPTELERAIGEADIVFTSTSATGCIVSKGQLERLGSGKDKPVMFVDISVPRNVEADCSDVPGVFAYDVDDLKMVVARNTALRRREMLEAEDILAEEHTKFSGWQQSLTATPAISKMQEKFEDMRAQEMRKVGRLGFKQTTGLRCCGGFPGSWSGMIRGENCSCRNPYGT